MRIRMDPPLPDFDPDTMSMLEEIYALCACPQRLDRDPLAIVVRFPDIADREVVGLVASVLAFGAVDLILRATEAALAPLGIHPAGALLAMSDEDIAETWRNFQYRFMFPEDMAALMRGIRNALNREGSLEEFFRRQDPGGEDLGVAAGAFAMGIRELGAWRLRPNLLPDTRGGSACKRLLLYLRWMVRKDAVDPGGWNRVDPARLIVPLDTHMFATCRDRLGFFGKPTAFKIADMRAALRASAAFRLYAPDDPVKYDFALTRPGIDPKPGDERFGCL